MKKQKIKIIYDATVLIWALKDPMARTGVYTVVDNLARALYAREDVDLVLVAYEKLDELRLAWGDDPLVEAILDDSRFAIGQEPLFYLGTYLPVPQHISNIPNLSVFQVIYDLIPIVHPEWFTVGVKQFCENVVNSLGNNGHALCISNTTQNDLLNLSKIPPENSSVMYIAAKKGLLPIDDPNLISSMRQKIGLPAVAPYILSVATREPRKNLDSIVRAFITACSEIESSNLHLVLVGTQGWGTDMAAQLISSRPDLAHRIIQTGYVDDALLAPLYSDALCFIYLSLYEGFGLPPLEAMTCGCPVIVSGCASLKEVVGSAGIYVSAREAAETSDAIKLLWSNPTLRSSFSKLAKDQSELFSWDKAAEQVVNKMASMVSVR